MTKKVAAWIFLLALQASLAAAMVEKLRAEEWAGLTEQRKIYFTLGSMEEFQKKGTLFRHTVEDYMRWMDQAAAGSSSEKSADEIFSALVASHETVS